MQNDTTSEAGIAGVILGQLYPPLDLAAEELYERVSAGERIGGTNESATSLDFGTGILDHVLVEAFRACVPALKSFLMAGGMTLIAEWIRHRTERQRRVEELESLRRQNAAFRESIERLVNLLLLQTTAGNAQVMKARILQIITDVPERATGVANDDF